MFRAWRAVMLPPAASGATTFPSIAQLASLNRPAGLTKSIAQPLIADRSSTNLMDEKEQRHRQLFEKFCNENFLSSEVSAGNKTIAREKGD